ncbi:MAG TPA: Ku protein [Polyangiaceae bacterium]|nr:Ku protein [Polyangiaceae bacterium]
MAARAIWKGVLHFGSHELPVKLYSAVEEHGVHFRLLHERSKQPVRQQLVDPSNDEVVEYADVQRGYAIPEGFVVLQKEELDSLAPQASRDIEVERFVSTQKLGPEWLVRPYYLGPDGESESYFALAQALDESDEEGVAHWVMRGKEYSGVLRAIDGYLMLITLRHADEVIKRDELPKPQGRAHSEKELKMAEQLIAAYEDAFDPEQYKDEYRERVLEFVTQKAKGKKPRLKKPVEKREPDKLADALEKSLAGLRKAKADKTDSKKSESKKQAPHKASPRKERHVA